MITLNATHASISSTVAALSCVPAAPKDSRIGSFFAALLRALATMHV